MKNQPFWQGIFVGLLYFLACRLALACSSLYLLVDQGYLFIAITLAGLYFVSVVSSLGFISLSVGFAIGMLIQLVAFQPYWPIYLRIF